MGLIGIGVNFSDGRFALRDAFDAAINVVAKAKGGHAMTWSKPVALILIATLLLSNLAAFPAGAQPQTPPPTPARPTTGDEVAAGFTNVLYVPGKALFCGSTGFLWLVFMLVTAGVAYNEGARFVKAGCGGKWLVTGEDMVVSP